MSGETPGAGITARHTAAVDGGGAGHDVVQIDTDGVSAGDTTDIRGDWLQYGPVADVEHEQYGFSARAMARIDEAMTLSSRESGLTFSVYVGPLAEPSRDTAEAMFQKLADDGVYAPVLVAVSPTQRILQIVTGELAARRLPNRSCALAALGMRAAFTGGDLAGGIVTGLRMLADAAGSPRNL